MAGPGQVLAEGRGLEAVHQRPQAVEVGRIQRPGAPDGQAHAMQRQRPGGAHPLQHLQLRAAGHHEVLGMHFDEPDRRGRSQ